jgi:prepilin-type N-terminal cleavage/methylation domain-containing protein
MQTIFSTLKQKKEKGFTLLEVTFVITIFAIMASILLFRFKDFGAKTALDNEAQDIALRIIGAQKAAVAGVLTPGLLGTGDTTAPSYGVYFVSGSASDPLAHQFTSFADLNHDGFFNDYASPCPAIPTSSNDCRSVTTITTGDYINQFCFKSAVSGATCATGNIALHVVFKRPLHDALMKSCSTPGTCPLPDAPDISYIGLTSGSNPDLSVTIAVTALGQVSVIDLPSCAPLGLCP